MEVAGVAILGPQGPDGRRGLWPDAQFRAGHHTSQFR